MIKDYAKAVLKGYSPTGSRVAGHGDWHFKQFND